MTQDLPVLGTRLRSLRKSRRMSLEQLAEAAGVSKSMVSQIERNEANPTVAVLWRLTNALSVALAEFLTLDQPDVIGPEIEVVTPHATPIIKSPDGKCILRILMPPEMAGKVEWYELTMDPGGVLSSEAHQVNSREHLSVLAGEVLVEVSGTQKRVLSGETARYPVDLQHSIRNQSAESATCIMIVEYKF